MCNTLEEDKRKMEKDSVQLDSTKGLDDLVMTSEDFNGGYIEASQEAYDLLLLLGHKERGVLASHKIYAVTEGKIYGYSNANNFQYKQFYINKGKLSWGKPDSTSKHVTDTDVGDIHAELKEKYATGEYNCFVKHMVWQFIKENQFWHKDAEYQLIKKEDSHVAQAVIENPDIEVLMAKNGLGSFINGREMNEFFERYNEDMEYEITSPTQEPFKVTETTEIHEKFQDPEMLEAFLAKAAFRKHPQSREFKEANNIVGNQYENLTIDTVARSKANHTPEQQKAICQFMIDKYTNREKDQDTDDIIKIRFYTDWLEEIVKGKM